MSETFENRQFFIMSLVCDWFSHSGQVETTMLWKGEKVSPKIFGVFVLLLRKILFQFVCINWNAYFKMSQLPNSAETRRCTIKQREIGLLRMCSFSSSQLCQLTWHTSSSIPLHTRCTCAGLSCTA